MSALARPTLISARALADASHYIARPAAVLISGDPNPTVLAVGAEVDVNQHPGAAFARRLSAPDALLLPAFANSHAHLDLTHIGPLPYDPQSGFRSFIDAVRERRHTDPQAIEASVLRGASLLRQSGVLAVGDIAGAVRGKPDLAAARALRSTGLAGVSYLEFFAMSRESHLTVANLEPMVAEFAREPSSVRVGLQPHAPYSVSPKSYETACRIAARHGLPVCTHLSESPEELEFVSSGSGPLRNLLDMLGIWHDELASDFASGHSPVEHLFKGSESPSTVVHLNRCSDVDLAILARSRSSVVYCPRASAYFGWERVFGPHRYRDMIAAGVNVALGTDSIINLPQADRISILDEMRFLFARDATDPGTLLAMATVNAALSLGIDPKAFTLQVGSKPLGILSVPIGTETHLLESLLRSNEQPVLLWSRS